MNTEYRTRENVPAIWQGEKMKIMNAVPASVQPSRGNSKRSSGIDGSLRVQIRGAVLGMVLAIWALSVAALPAHAQATVNETLETASLWVDSINGSDSNPGTQASPFQTITKAVGVAEKSNQAGIGTKVTINPGAYRETITLTGTVKDTSIPITFEAATPGTVYVTGADVWTGWQQDGSNPNLYTNAWPNHWGLCAADVPPAPQEADIVRRREMIFAGGISLTQVLSMNDLVYPGMFFVDETNGVVYIYPPASVNMSATTIEVSTRNEDVNMWGKNGVVFRGMNFVDASSCRTDHAFYVHGASSNILLDNDTFEWNNSDGIRFDPPSTNFTIQNSTASFNGRSGIFDYHVKNALYLNDTLDYNNWRGAQGAYYAWGASGAYLFSEHGDTVTNVTANFNETSGIHWDTNNENVTASNLFTANNLIDGVFVEKNDGPVSITGLTSCNNGVNGYTSWQPQSSGFVLRNSESVTLTGSTLYGNHMNGLFVEGVAGGISVTNWETGQIYNLISQNFTNTSNVIESLLGTDEVMNDGVLGGTDWATFQSTLVSNQNTWWNSSSSTQFVVPTPTENSFVDFSGWQSVSAQDTSSTYSAPAVDPSAACTVAPTANDYWFVVDNGTPTMDASGTTVYTFTVDPLVFSGTVNLTYDLEGVAGLSASLSNSSIDTAGTATLTVSAAITTPPGSYQFPVIANGGGITHTSYVYLTIPQTSIRIVPATLNFPDTQVNYTSAAQAAVITNYGATPVTITSITTSPQFSQNNVCNGLIPANGGTCTLNIMFTPNASTTFNGSLTITDSDPSGTQTLALTGTGLAAPAVTLSSYTLAYGSVGIGSSGSMTTTLTNSGSGTLTISSITISGTNMSDYSQTNTCGSSVEGGGTCAITVVFAPTASGTRIATCTIVDNAPTASQTVSLTGTGTSPAAKFSPTSLVFGTHPVGTTATKLVTLSNSGSSTLLITSIALTGSGASAYLQTNTCGGSVVPFGQCTITVTFAPTAGGSFSADVTVTDNAAGGSQNVALNGTGAVAGISFSPASVAFASQTVGKKSTGQTISVTNTGVVTLTITSVTLTGSNPGDFSFTKSCGTYLGAGKTCKATVFFDPTTQGLRSSSLSFTDNGTGGTQTVALTGTGL